VAALPHRVSARAGIVVTGTEVLTGRVTDRNGPWLSERLRELGVDHAYTLVVGDRREDMDEALRFMAARGVDAIVTSGGLGPTADDLTAEVVGAFAGRGPALRAVRRDRPRPPCRHAVLRRRAHVDEQVADLLRAGGLTITVARVRREWRPRVDDLPDAPQATFTAAAVVLFRSHLGGRGPPRYEALERVALG
jgi:molybdenum cofactor synthesis domain-containing protein